MQRKAPSHVGDTGLRACKVKWSVSNLACSRLESRTSTIESGTNRVRHQSGTEKKPHTKHGVPLCLGKNPPGYWAAAGLVPHELIVLWVHDEKATAVLQVYNDLVAIQEACLKSVFLLRRYLFTGNRFPHSCWWAIAHVREWHQRTNRCENVNVVNPIQIWLFKLFLGL